MVRTGSGCEFGPSEIKVRFRDILCGPNSETSQELFSGLLYGSCAFRGLLFMSRDYEACNGVDSKVNLEPCTVIRVYAYPE